MRDLPFYKTPRFPSVLFCDLNAPFFASKRPNLRPFETTTPEVTPGGTRQRGFEGSKEAGVAL
jgi:hypothetical protein